MGPRGARATPGPLVQLPEMVPTRRWCLLALICIVGTRVDFLIFFFLPNKAKLRSQTQFLSGSEEAPVQPTLLLSGPGRSALSGPGPANTPTEAGVWLGGEGLSYVFFETKNQPYFSLQKQKRKPKKIATFELYFSLLSLFSLLASLGQRRTLTMGRSPR